MLVQILQNQGEIVAQLTDVQAAIAKLGTDISAEIAAVTAKLQALQAAGGASPSDLDGLVASLNSLDATVTAETTSIAGSAPPAGGTA
jgi:hypothetical protein